jgi:hypothetical protein
MIQSGGSLKVGRVVFNGLAWLPLKEFGAGSNPAAPTKIW